MPNFDNVSSSTSRGGLTTYENVVEPLVYNVVDPLIVAEVAQPTESVEKIHVRRLVRQKWPAIANDFVVYLSEDAYDVGDVIDPKNYL